MAKKVITTFLLVLLCTYLKSQDVNQLNAHTQLKRHSAFLNISSDAPSTDKTKNRLDSIVEYNLNELTSEWDKKYLKDEYIYHNSDITEYKLMLWNKLQGDWENKIKEEYDYASPHQMSGSITSLFINNNWVNDTKKEYKYINNNLLDEIIEYTWNSETSIWQEHKKCKYLYTFDEKIDVILFYDYDVENTNWITRKKTTYEYINDKIHYINKWIDKDNQWQLNERYWYLYDNIKWQLYTISYYQWYDGDNDLKLISRKGFSYNTYDEFASESEVSRSVNETQWSAISKQSSEFDDSYSYEELLLPYNPLLFTPFYFHHKTTSSTISTKEINNDPFIPYRHIKFFYRNDDTNTDTSEKDIFTLKVFPNPATDILWVEGYNEMMPIRIELFSLNGQKVLDQKLINNNTVDISRIKTGIYIYKVTQDNQVNTNKILIR
ncbi:T9SS type A sorting domain-containing protein [Plebeiibacterium sediminum]|uniref:T9SS type A sorting domain-containing protein n=1 Tax=Plebeiibacterium sediminum TaxID=2992112 RepID=A0AAE3SH40_9BACT|nr:T9SS type A sorting domain-containing protein [Plebeiobacterium sediminum]MCW3788956.1 T9SS type A sorting domain-containing protein [Plebeiobacterium sediminum]